MPSDFDETDHCASHSEALLGAGYTTGGQSLLLATVLRCKTGAGGVSSDERACDWISWKASKLSVSVIRAVF